MEPAGNGNEFCGTLYPVDIVTFAFDDGFLWTLPDAGSARDAILRYPVRHAKPPGGLRIDCALSGSRFSSALSGTDHRKSFEIRFFRRVSGRPQRGRHGGFSRCQDEGLRYCRVVLLRLMSRSAPAKPISAYAHSPRPGLSVLERRRIQPFPLQKGT